MPAHPPTHPPTRPFTAISLALTYPPSPPRPQLVKARLQELGPRFTLRLVSLQKGTFDSKGGEFEFVSKPELDTSRRKFHL